MTDLVHLNCPSCQALNRIPQARLNDGPKCGKCKEPLLTGKPIDVNESNFAALVEASDVPVIIDFWASWCGPCKMMTPIFTEVAAKESAHWRFVKINTETNQQLATRFAIRSIPSLLVFKEGKEIARQAGAMQAGQLQQWLASQL
ncbi:MAG: thioredoxin TrxC [Pseudomonadaceae bacterium]|nr:thioredoxin TrxC [Pseudomonadaceae bacterium]